MKKIFTCSLLALLAGAINSSAQIFWTENFESGSSSGLVVTAYTGPNGTWTQTITGSEDANPNTWYVSCAEAGHLAGVCGSTCGSSPGLGATLHVSTETGSALGDFGDIGASYDAGGICGITPTAACVTTDRRAESPVIDCSARAGITMSYYYIENGDGTTDNGTVWYYNGSAWSLLEDPPKTTVCMSGQGQWAHRTVALPASADHNPNVKIGFRWVNNDDGVGTDPSFAIDSVSLSVASSGTPTVSASFTISISTVCQDSCTTFTSTSTSSGTIDSIRWSIPGMAIATPHASPLSVCFPTAGSFTMHLYVYSGGVVDSTTHVITVIPTPHPVITRSGHTLSVSGAYTAYQWASGVTPIAGATNASFTYTVSGSYNVGVDSAGCQGYSILPFYTLGVSVTNTADIKYWVTQQGNSAITFFASQPIDEELAINIFDPTGRRVYSDNWNAGKEMKQVSGISVPPGLYIIRLNNRNTSAVLKWMRQ